MGVPDGCVLDLGAGTGWYLARVLDRLPGRSGLALDLSRHALRRAARAHARIGAVAADAWGPLPVRDAAVGAGSERLRAAQRPRARTRDRSRAAR